MAMLTNCLPAAWGQEPLGRVTTAQFQNPLFAGDYADPTILRVGGDFYFTHTSYRYAPGLTVWHSRDLVNWLPISHVLNDINGTLGEVWLRILMRRTSTSRHWEALSLCARH